ncbi:hypothetical protein M404DRAFT_35415 [Pisolithus tinctorius Marx 270]|uniref:Uncharacterized protein n=1 Tax=Pisolithus tinctorius Marx 270 TaxID=870435 RepID=A0A0C3NEY8_PISTI|nr:hypothetical protein M404DRAFT_35415 [Pisolithus tinctorius Marx 270]
MRDQVTTVLTAALGHIWDLIKTAPQPEERLETIYVWVEDWDKTWTSIRSWWKYVDDNGITVPKVRDECMCDYTEESAMCQNLLVPGAIAIADLRHPVEQRQVHIDDIFEDYQERQRQQVKVKAARPATLKQGSKGKGKEKATDEVDELENDEGDRPPNPDPSKTGAPAPKVDLRCRECAKAKRKCSRSLRVGRKRKNAGSGEMAAGPSHKWVKSVTVMTETLGLTRLKLRIPARKPPPRQNSEPPPEHPTPRASPPLSSDMPPPPVPQPPLFLPSATPAPRPRPELTLPPMDNPGDLGDSGLFGRPTGLLDDPPAPVVSTQDESEGPPVKETPQVTNPSELTTRETLAECI